MESSKKKKAEGKNDNNDNTEPNGMKSESENYGFYNAFISFAFNLKL